eukprot:scpid67231/ scgid7697/ 
MDIGRALHHVGMGLKSALRVEMWHGKLAVLTNWIVMLLFQAYSPPENSAMLIQKHCHDCVSPTLCEPINSTQDRYGRVFQIRCLCVTNICPIPVSVVAREFDQDRVLPAWYLFLLCLGMTVVKFLMYHPDAVPSAVENAWKRIRIGSDATVTNMSSISGNEWNRHWMAFAMATAVTLSLCLLYTFVDPPLFWQSDPLLSNRNPDMDPMLILGACVRWSAMKNGSGGCHPVDRTCEAEDAHCAGLSRQKRGCGRLLKWIEASAAAFPDIAILLALWASTRKEYSGQLAQEVLLFFVNDVTDSKNNWRMNMVFQPEAYIAACLAFKVMTSRGLGRFVTMIVDTRVFPVSRDKLNWALLMARELHWSIKRGVVGRDNGAIGNYLVQADTTRRRSATSFIIHGMAEEEVPGKKHTRTKSSDGTEVLNLLRNVFGQRLAPGDIIGTQRLGKCTCPTEPTATNTGRSRPILVQTRTPEICQKALNLRKSVQYKTFSSHLNIQISEYFSKEELEIQQRLRRRFETFRNQGLICHMCSTYIELP